MELPPLIQSLPPAQDSPHDFESVGEILARVLADLIPQKYEPDLSLPAPIHAAHTTWGIYEQTTI